MEGDRLDEAEVSAVFARAAELDAEHPDEPVATLDLAAVEEVGRQVGLSPAAIRRAVGELRAGLLAVPGPADVAPAAVRVPARPRHVVGPPGTRVERTVPGGAPEVHRLVAAALRDQLLEARRDLPLRSAWVPRRGLGPQLQRGLDMGRRLRFTSVERLEVAVVEVDGPDGATAVRVCLDARLEPSRRASGAVLAAGGGLGTGVALLGAGLAEPGISAAGILGGALGGAGWLAARRSYLRSLAGVTEALEGLLDQLEVRPRPRSGRRRTSTA